MFKKIQSVDDRLINFVPKMQTERRNKVMIIFTRLGDKGLIWFVLCIILLFNKPTRTLGYNVLGSLLLAHLLGEILIKHIVCRIRPCHKIDSDEHIIKKPKYYSFPSGHTTSSFAVFSVTAFSMSAVALPVFIIASLIAFSRFYLRVHYLTDIIAGILLGTISGFLAKQLLSTVPLMV